MTDRSEHQHDWRVDVLDLLLAITRRRWIVLGVVGLAAAIGLYLPRLQEPYYEAATTFVLLPREKPILDLSVQSASVETSDDTAKRSDSASLALPPNPELYTTLVRSSDVADRVLADLTNNGELSKRTLPSVAEIRAATTVRSSEEGVIRLAFQSPDPVMASVIVNALVTECEEASKAIERQLLMQQAGFLGVAIEHAEMTLERARDRLAAFTELFGVSDPAAASARSMQMLRTLDDTEARLELELARTLVHRTDLDPHVARLRRELEMVSHRRDAVREAYCGDLAEHEYARILAEWQALKQDVTLRQDLLMSMRARFDVFTIRADQPSGNLAVIKPASVPSSPAGPSKKKALVLAVLAGGIIACVACVLLDQLSSMLQQEVLRQRLAELVQSLKLTRKPLTRRGKGAGDAGWDSA